MKWFMFHAEENITFLAEKNEKRKAKEMEKYEKQNKNSKS